MMLMHTTFILLCLGYVHGYVLPSHTHRHLAPIQKRQAFDPNANPSQSFNPNNYKAQSFDPNQLQAAAFNPGGYSSSKYNASSTNQLQSNSKDPSQFQMGQSNAGTNPGSGGSGFDPDKYNSQSFSFLNPSSQLGTKNNNNNNGGNPGNFNPNAVNAGVGISQTGSTSGNAQQTGGSGSGNSQANGASQTGSFSPGKAPAQTGGNFNPGSFNGFGSGQSVSNFNPNAVNGMSKGVSQTGQPGQMFDPNNLNNMGVSQTG